MRSLILFFFFFFFPCPILLSTVPENVHEAEKVVFPPKCRVHLLLVYGLCALPAAFPASPLLLQGSCVLVALSLSAVPSFC